MLEGDPMAGAFPWLVVCGVRVRYCTPILSGDGDDDDSPCFSCVVEVDLTPTRILASNWFSTSIPLRSSFRTERSYSHLSFTSSQSFAGGEGGLRSPAETEAGLAVEDRPVLGSGAGGTRRFSVDVCNRPGCRYGPANQATSSRPSGKIVPPGYIGGNTLFLPRLPSLSFFSASGDKLNRYCLVSPGSRLSTSIPVVEDIAVDVKPDTGSSITRLNNIGSKDEFWMRISRFVSSLRDGSRSMLG
jgi:hypothetical protein